MAFSIHNDVSAMIGRRHMGNAASSVDKSMERLASGVKINSAMDDAAGLQISNRLNVQARGIDVALRNVNEGVSIAQAAEGAMAETSEILQKMRQDALLASNGSNSKADLHAIQQNMTALKDEINNIAGSTTFAGNELLNGSYGTKSFHIGPNNEGILLKLENMHSDTDNMGGLSFVSSERKESDWVVEAGKNDLTINLTDNFGDEMTIQIEAKQGDDIEELATFINGQQDSIRASVSSNRELQFFAGSDTVKGDVSFDGALADEFDFGSGDRITVESIDVTSPGGAQQAIAVIDTALNFVDGHRADLGSFQNRFDHILSNLENMGHAVESSKGKYLDTDYAKEATAMASSQILQQASASMFAQAKQSPSNAVSLLG